MTRVRWLALLVSLFLAPFCQLVAPSAATVSSAATSAALAAIPTATTTSTATALWTYDRPADVALTRHRALSTGLTAMSAISQSVIRASAPDWRLAAEDDGVSQTAEDIANGHAYDKHVIQQGEYSEISNRQEFAQLIQNTMDNATAEKSLAGGRYAYWDANDGTVVITDPGNPDGGTVFRPTNGYGYYQGLK